ncbi:hypothetical protein APHAL10511_008529 [Amanita phalloides]|nr:hypothetical protein APHAL10511_008529 [Amanita phalloides]
MQYQDFVPISYLPDFDQRAKHASPMRSKLPSTIRQSQICGVPLLETQLIPSLHDTIDRMTRPPTGVAIPTSARPSYDAKKNSGNTPSSFQSNSPLPPSTPTHDIETTASRSRLAPKTLKSVLRSPKTPVVATASPSQNSLRSMKSILSKKLKMPPPTSSKSRGISSKDIFVCVDSMAPQSTSRSRSRTDPGQQPELSTKPQQPTYHQATTSEDSIPQPAPTTPILRHKLQNSSIPRPAASSRRRARTAQPEPTTEDSDIELRYETESRDRRRLTVANAEIYPSSSSASGLSSGTDGRQSLVTPKQYSTLRRETKRSFKGLGLTVDSGSPSKEPAAGSNNTIFGQNDYVVENTRRRAALLKLVSKLDFDKSSARDHQADVDESDYAGEEGVALSGSNLSFTKKSSLPSNDDDDASQYEDDHELDEKYQSQDDNRPASVTPTTGLQSNACDTSFSRQPQNQTHGRTLHAPSSGHTVGIGAKSPCRTPVIRHSVFEGNPVLLSPAALKRRSIYLEEPDAALQGSASPRMEDGASTRRNRDVDDISVISDTANAIAARARRAFGIPQSASDKMYDNPELRLNRKSLAESEFSSAGSDFWRATREDEQGNEGSELSVGAASLFREFSDGGKETKDNARGGRSRASSVGRHLEVSVVGDMTSRNPCPSAHQDGSIHQANGSNDSLIGPVEIERQKIICELCESEETFVARLHVCVQLFILPLRVQNSKEWVDGVPPNLAHFLDWFEDIANLHTRHIVHTLRNIQRMTAHTRKNVIRSISDPLLTLVPRLEIYQPYLVHLSSVASAISRMVRESGNDFGEFVAIQQRTPECGGWGLEAFLFEPMNRLTKYCDIFSRLLSCTPKDHPDYIPTFSLLQSIDVVVRVMTEVKVREDEYDLLKDLVTRIRGLPPNLQLVTRDRRFLCQGKLYLADDGDQYLLLDKAGNQDVPTHTKPTMKERAGNRISRLASAVQAWDSLRGRSGSIKSTASSCAGLSIRSDVSQHFSKSEYVPSCETPPPSEVRKGVHLFVFSDLAILATSVSQDLSKPTFQVMSGIGLCQIFHVEIEADRGEDESVAVVLDLVPLNDELKMASTCLTTVRGRLLVPKDTACGGSARHQIDQWRLAFQRCSQSTLRSLSYPNKMNFVKCQDPNHLMTPLLGSGLPVPKSPSTQVLDAQNGLKSDSIQEEREERGWWALRFQQVLQEMYKS